MRLKSITFKGFRNLAKTTLEFDPGISVFAFTGENGQGKTNILEAIFLLSVSKSFRTRENNELVGFENDFCSLSAATEVSSEAQDLDLIVTRNPAKKTLKINGVQKRAADYVGKFNVVFFSPDDMGMIHLSPSVRRRYLDLLLSQLDHDYLEDSLKYMAILKQRNSLLKQLADRSGNIDELDFWDSQLAEVGQRIQKKRAAITSELAEKASSVYRDVSDHQEVLEINYIPSFSADEVTLILDQLRSSRKRDLMTGSTQIGPHRDDLQFLCDGRDMASFASRGEWRSLILALKFAEIELLRAKKGESPVVLLDDVFSELDDRRQKYLFNVLKDTQIFITTTHIEFLDVITADKQVFDVSKGQVKEI